MLTRIRGLCHDRKGAALVEFALSLTLLILLLLPVFDLGRGFYFKTQVMTAAQAGAQWAFTNGWTNFDNTAPQSNMCKAAINSTPLDTSVDCTTTNSGNHLVYSANPTTNDPTLGAPNFSLACKCVDGTALNTTPGPLTPSTPFKPQDCLDSTKTTPCASPNNQAQPGAYVTVRTKYTYTPLFGYLGFGGPMTLQATSTQRIQ
jgi:Flp pilus assembly protein TadG